MKNLIFSFLFAFVFVGFLPTANASPPDHDPIEAYAAVDIDQPSPIVSPFVSRAPMQVDVWLYSASPSAQPVHVNQSNIAPARQGIPARYIAPHELTLDEQYPEEHVKTLIDISKRYKHLEPDLTGPVKYHKLE